MGFVVATMGDTLIVLLVGATVEGRTGVEGTKLEAIGDTTPGEIVEFDTRNPDNVGNTVSFEIQISFFDPSPIFMQIIDILAHTILVAAL